MCVPLDVIYAALFRRVFEMPEPEFNYKLHVSHTHQEHLFYLFPSPPLGRLI